MEKSLSVVKENFKELPNNIEAEQAVIGSILVTNEIFLTDVGQGVPVTHSVS